MDHAIAFQAYFTQTCMANLHALSTVAAPEQFKFHFFVLSIKFDKVYIKRRDNIVGIAAIKVKPTYNSYFMTFYSLSLKSIP